MGMRQKYIECIGYYGNAIEQFRIDTSTNNSAEFLKKYVKKDIPPQENEIFENIKTIIIKTGKFSQIRKQAENGEFLDEVLAALKEASFNKAKSFENGVECGDIMALRGQSFSAAVFLGMNEGNMPITPSPDPVLREEYRSYFTFL